MKANYVVSMYRKTGFEIIDENEEEYIIEWRYHSIIWFDDFAIPSFLYKICKIILCPFSSFNRSLSVSDTKHTVMKRSACCDILYQNIHFLFVLCSLSRQLSGSVSDQGRYASSNSGWFLTLWYHFCTKNHHNFTDIFKNLRSMYLPDRSELSYGLSSVR